MQHSQWLERTSPTALSQTRLPCLRVGASGPVVEKDHIGLHALSIKDARWQSKDRMQVGVLQKFAPDHFAGAALEQYVVGHNHGRPSSGFQHGPDVLHKVQLLV